MRDIESDWGDDEYSFTESSRPSSRQEPGPDRGWDDDSTRPSPRTYDEGWLYGSDTPEETSYASEPGKPSPTPEEPEDVYDANYRVIIPPYDSKD